MLYEQKWFAAAVVGLALVLSAVVFGSFYYAGQRSARQDGLAVTGSAKTRVTSDQVKMVISLFRTVRASQLGTGYNQVAKDLTLTRALLEKAGLPPAEIVESPIAVNQNWSNDANAELSYNLNQTLTVQSGDVAKITDISKQVPALATQGAIVSIQSLEYYYSKLPDLRVSLLTNAIKDAKARAEKIAQGTGRHVGSVQAASSGVVQVLSPNSVDIADYGNYDTSSIEKDVMVTVKATFRLE